MRVTVGRARAWSRCVPTSTRSSKRTPLGLGFHDSGRSATLARPGQLRTSSVVVSPSGGVAGELAPAVPLLASACTLYRTHRLRWCGHMYISSHRRGHRFAPQHCRTPRMFKHQLSVALKDPCPMISSVIDNSRSRKLCKFRPSLHASFSVVPAPHEHTIIRRTPLHPCQTHLRLSSSRTWVSEGTEDWRFTLGSSSSPHNVMETMLGLPLGAGCYGLQRKHSGLIMGLREGNESIVLIHACVAQHCPRQVSYW
jgi:hypothetical protein